MTNWLDKYKPQFSAIRIPDEYLQRRYAAAILLNIDDESLLGEILIGHRSGCNSEGQEIFNSNELISNWIRKNFINQEKFNELFKQIEQHSSDFSYLLQRYIGIYDALGSSSVLLDSSKTKPSGDGKSYFLNIKECIEWAEARGIVVDNNIKEAYKMCSVSLSHEPYCDVSHPGYSKELDVAIRVWLDVVSNQAEKPKGQSFKKAIRKWIDKNHSDLSNEAKERIATLVNPNKNGGAPITGIKT